MTVSDRIRSARTRAGLSQTQLAERLMVSRQAVSKWESGKGMPDVDNLRRMATLFDVSVDHLLADGSQAPVGDVVLRRAVHVAGLEPYRAPGTLAGSRTHAAVREVFPGAGLWPLARGRATNPVHEGLEWVLSILFDTPFVIFATGALLRDRGAFYLVEQDHRNLLVRVSTDAVEARELPPGPVGSRFAVGEDTFRRSRRVA